MRYADPTDGQARNDCLVAVIVAGTNEKSNGDLLADELIRGMDDAPGIRIEKMRLKDLNLHHFTLDDYAEESCEPDYLRVKKAILEASGVIFVTPIWNFSVPAHLKNLIDRMGAFGLDAATHSKGQFKGKPFGLVFTGGAPMIAWQALMYLTTLHMAEALKYYGGSIVLRHFEPKCVEGKGVFGVVVDKRPSTLAQMRDYGAHFGRIARRFKDEGTLPLTERLWRSWFELLYRVGNRIMYPISKRQ